MKDIILANVVAPSFGLIFLYAIASINGLQSRLKRSELAAILPSPFPVPSPSPFPYGDGEGGWGRGMEKAAAAFFLCIF